MNIKLISILIILSIQCIAVSGQKTADDWTKKGNEFYNNGAYDLAVKSYDKAIDLSEASLNKYRNLSPNEYSNNPFALNDTIKLMDQQIKDGWYHKGLSLLALNRIVDADAAFAKAGRPRQEIDITRTEASLSENISITGLDATSFPKIMANIFVDTPCAKSGGLKKEDFKVLEDGNDTIIGGSYFTGNASGKKLDLAIAFDDTGSMGEEIHAMKSKVQDLTDQIKTSGIDARYSLLSFKDSYSIKANWTNDSIAFKSSVDSFQAIGGEDEPEVSLDAIESVLSMGFRPDAQKVVLAITDAHAHHIGDGTTYSKYTKDEVRRDLKDNGIIFIPVSPSFEIASGGATDLRDVANEIQSIWIDIYSADFSTILDQFQRIITGTYVLEYTSPDLTPGKNRNVIVMVNNQSCDGAVGSANVTYKNPHESGTTTTTSLTTITNQVPTTISGHWAGSLYQSSGTTFKYYLDLLQSGNQITGTSRIEFGEYYSIMDLSGTLNNEILSFTETGVKERKIASDWWFILKTANLNLVGDSHPRLEGTWTCYNSESVPCNGAPGGFISVLKTEV